MTHKSGSDDKSGPNAPQRAPKKSETLEVRIPYETKQAFLTACREDGTTASEKVRESVQSYLDERERPLPQSREALIMKFPEPVRRYAPRVAASMLAAVTLTTFAVLPSAAAPDFQAQFKKMDTNGDGVITADEFANRNVVVSLSKNDKGGKGADTVTVETRIQRSAPDGVSLPAGGKTETKQDAFAFWLPDELTGGEPQEQNLSFATTRIIRHSDDGADASATPPTPPTPISIEDLRKKEFEGIDADHDGKVSFAEYQAKQKAMLTRGFEMLDANSDKSLTQAEYDKIGTPPMPKMPDIDDGKHREIQIISGGTKYTPAQLKAAFTKLDANKDKKLSLQEYLPPA